MDEKRASGFSSGIVMSSNRLKLVGRLPNLCTLTGYLVQDRLLDKEDYLKNRDENCGAKM